MKKKLFLIFVLSTFTINTVSADYRFPFLRLKAAAKSELDLHYKNKARQIAKRAGNHVRKAIRNTFYADPSGAYVEIKGKRYPVLHTRSHLVDQLFTFATGSSLTKQIETLPIGVRQVSDFARQKLEAMIVDQVIGNLAKLPVELIVERALLLSYGYTQDKIEELIGSYYQDESYQNLLQENSLATAYQDLKLSPKEVDSVQNATQVILDLENHTSIASTNGITFQDVVNYYHDKTVDYINSVLAEFLIKGIATASGKVAKKSSDTAITYIQASGIVTSFVGGTPGAIVGLTTAFALEKAKPSIQEFMSKKAYKTGKKLARRFAPVQYLKTWANWKVSSHNEIIEEDEFVVLERQTATLTDWAKQALKPTSQQLFSALNPGGYKPWDVNANLQIDADYERPLNPYMTYSDLGISQEDDLDDQAIELHKAQVKDRELRKQVSKEAAAAGKQLNIKKGYEQPDPTVFSRVKNFVKWW